MLGAAARRWLIPPRFGTQSRSAAPRSQRVCNPPIRTSRGDFTQLRDMKGEPALGTQGVHVARGRRQTICPFPKARYELVREGRRAATRPEAMRPRLGKPGVPPCARAIHEFRGPVFGAELRPVASMQEKLRPPPQRHRGAEVEGAVLRENVHEGGRS